MWQRFTERARRVVFFAQEEAGRFGENYVSTDHLLLALVRETGSTAMRVLISLGVTPDMIVSEIEKQATRGDGRLGQDMQLTPRAKRVIDLAYDEARAFQHNHIGTEHLLLGLVREAEGVGGRVLQKLGVDIDRVRNLVANLPQPTSRKACSESSVSPMKLEDGSVAGISSYLEKEALSKLKPYKETQSGSTTTSVMGGKDLIGIDAVPRAGIKMIFDMTASLKNSMSPEKQRELLKGKTLAMIFEKPSLRTRVSFEIGIFQLGGHGIYLAPSDISLGKRESVADVARTIGRMSDIIMARVFEHEKVTDLAKYAGVPVINGLSDLEHPCQALADFYTILEMKGKFDGLKLAFMGDGNNVAHSLMLLAAKVGTNFVIACPEGYEPNAEVTAAAQAFAKEVGSTVEITHDPIAAADDADIIYTDVWASMGQEAEAEERAKIFAPYQVNVELMKHAKDDAIFMHCLPAHRGSEVTDEVVDGKWSVVFDEAENRLHAQKAVMVLLAG